MHPAWIMMMPLTAHRHEHLAHHRHTNQPDDDPDYVVADMTRSPFHAIRAALAPRLAFLAAGFWVEGLALFVGGWTGRVVTLLWGFQNYLSIHHLYPRVPFYTYRALFEEIEPIMAARGAPIYHLGTGGLQARESVPA